MVHFIAFFEAAQNRNGIFDIGLIDQHRLEAPLQGAVLLDIFTVLIQAWLRRCSAARRAPASA